MKSKNISSFLMLSFLLVGGMLVLLTGCTPDKGGPIGDKPKASFTISPVAGRVNTYALASTSTGAFNYQWDKGSGDFVKGSANDTAYFPLHGTYNVVLRAFGRGGYDTAAQSVSIDVDDIQNNPNFQLLISTSWKLDASDGANAIVVGTEGNPAQYYGGGPLADCQIDDVYTFTSDLKLNYNANGSTFNAGNIAPNYTCAADKSFTGAAFTFDPSVPAGSAGVAAITLSGNIPDRFIGVTDIASNHYRIISISATSLILRAGTATETVDQFKFVPAQ